MLGEAFNCEVLLEVFEENPFLSDFYADRERYAFQTQMFFLISRYRQQHMVIAPTLQRNSLISDYLFDKDSLFAHLNLHGDELEIYKRVHAILGEQIPLPNLVVYLRADTDVLMDRIALRDRPYERAMSRSYIDRLRQAYERFFATYTAAPVLAIDTNPLDFVRNPEDRTQIIGQVRTALEEGGLQRSLLSPDAGLAAAEQTPAALDLLATARRLGDFQRFHQALDREKGFVADLYLNYICLNEEVGELGAELRHIWLAQNALLPRVGNRQEAQMRALQDRLPDLKEELADVLAYLLKLANDAGIDLEQAYREKMERNRHRVWSFPQAT